MPESNQAGPAGQGPMTGREAGSGVGFNAAGGSQPMPGWGFGRGAGRAAGGRGWSGGREGGGWGRRFCYRATGLTGWQRAALGMPGWGGSGPVSGPQQDSPNAGVRPEMAALREQASRLEAMLEQIRKDIAELSKTEARAQRRNLE